MQLFETIITCILLQLIKTQIAVELALSQQPVTIYSDSAINPQFVKMSDILDCSSTMYAYGQSISEYDNNAADQITISSNTLALSLSIQTQFNHFQPELNTSACTSTSCSISIRNNCPAALNTVNYFDVITLNIHPLGKFSYQLNCNISFNASFIDYGGLILIFFATLILIMAASLSRWNSFSGYGIEYGYLMITLVSSSILTVGLLGIYAPKAADIVLDIGNTISIIAAISIVSIEVLYFFRISRLQTRFKFKKIVIRPIDIIGVLLSIPVVVGWWLTGRNWIFSDILSIIIIVSVIKVFKFVSFKVALIAYLVMVSLYSAADILISIRYHNQYSSYALFQAETPYQFQIPLITPTYGQRCTWVSITTIAFPGLLVSYLRRFDQSRSTRIYLITAIATYFLGSVIWWIADAFSYYPLPFDAFCQPIMIIAFSMFAFKRKELRTLWEGKFFDEQFHNKSDIEAIGNKIAEQQLNPDLLLSNLGEALFFQMKDDSQLDRSERLESRIKNDGL